MKYGELNLGQIEALVNKLGGMDGVHRFLSDELVARVPGPSIHIWKRLAIGGISMNELQKRLTTGNFYLSDSAKDIMKNRSFAMTDNAHMFSFVRVRVGDLRFIEETTTAEIFNRDRLARFGLDLCEPQDGPFLRLAFNDQLKDHPLLIAMPPISPSNSGSAVFLLERFRDSEHYSLDTLYAGPRKYWDLSDEFVFRLNECLLVADK